MTPGRGWPHERYGPAPVPAELGEPIERNIEARTERRQRAREAGLDLSSRTIEQYAMGIQALDEAIETAMRVRVDGIATRAAMTAYADVTGYNMPSARGMDAALTAAFRAAGFEVEQ